ncbi:MAG: type II toxin-antitoxin system RelE/ParE family toxin [Porticoccus sp.]|nr:type II toxin-antitoxin system RelE/ParE family toxin [Porticoccus sp.]
MVEIVWTEPALSDLDAIADFIALEDPVAAQKLVRRVFEHVEQLADHPKNGSKPAELKGRNYRQIIEPPCRVFYRHDDSCVFILHVMRTERRRRASKLKRGSGRDS